jgi:hypothetical protein
MDKILFDINYVSIVQTVIKIFAFLLLSGFLLYVIYFTLSKILFRKSKFRKEANLQLALLWSIFSYFILFNIYLFILVYRNGVDSLLWTNIKFYLGIMSQIIIFIGVLVYFFIKRHTLIKIIKERSLN